MNIKIIEGGNSMNTYILNDRFMEHIYGGFDGTETPRYRIGARVSMPPGINYVVTDVSPHSPFVYWCKICSLPTQLKDWASIGDICCYFETQLTGGWQYNT